ncbi:HAD hydrolase-like protein [Bacillus thuringiensis]
MDQLKKEYPNPIKGFQAIGIAAHEYHQEVFDKVHPQHFLEPNEKLIQCLESISIPMFVVTLSSKDFSHQVLYSLGIKKQFEQTYSLGGVDTTVQDKILIYENIRSQLNLTSSEMIILGDNYAVDLEDAHKLGYHVFEITTTPRLITILEGLQEGAIQDEK